MPKSRFDPNLEDYEDPDEAIEHDFWERFREGREEPYVADEAMDPTTPPPPESSV